MNKYLLASVFFVLLLLFSASCKKSKEKKIVGAWSYVPTSNVNNPDNQQVWTFDGTNKLKVEVAESDTTYIYNGNYVVSSKFMKGNYVDITGIYVYWNGLYKIEKLKDDVMVLNRVEKSDDFENKEEGAFLWKEFIKK